MSVLDRKLVRDLGRTKLLLATIIAILSLGVSAYVANLSVYLNLELSRRSYYATCRMADFWLDIRKLPTTEVDRLLQIGGVAELRSRIRLPVTVDLVSVVRPLSGTLVSMPADPAPVINNLILRRGGYFTQERPNEVIINHAFAEARGLVPGDVIHIILNDRRQPLHIVGTAISSEFIFARAPGTVLPDKANYVILYVKRDFAEQAAGYEGAANQLVGLVAPQFRDNPQTVLEQLEERLKPFGEATTTPLQDFESHFFLSNDLESLRSVNLIVPTAFLLVAALILDVLMIRLAQQQRTIIGTLKALGYSNSKLCGHYVKFGLAVGAIGGLIGATFGYWLAGYMLGMFKDFYEFPRVVNRPYPLLILGSMLLGMGVATAGTLRGVRRVLRLHPAEAMRPRAPERSRRIILEKFPVLWNWLGFRWHMVFRYLARHRLRVFSGAFAAMTGAALIFQTLQLNDSLDELLSFTFDKMLISDYDLTFSDELPDVALLEAQRLPGIDFAEPVLNVPCTYYHGHRRKKGAITGIRQHAQLTVPRDAEGNVVTISGRGLTISRRLAEVLDLRVGQTVIVVPLEGNRDELLVPVSQVVESYVGTAAYADIDYLNQLVGEERALNQIQTRVNPDRLRRNELYRALKHTPRLQGIAAMREQKKQLLELLEPLQVINTVLIIFAGLLFSGGILTSSLIALAERRQEIATFRVLGYFPRQIAGIFLRESLIVNTLGVLFGLPLGYSFALFVNRYVATDLTRLPFIVYPSTWFLACLLGLMFTLLANLPVYRAIRRLNWLDALDVRE